MNINPLCPRCQYEYPYEDGHLWVCPECDHRWNPQAIETADEKVQQNELIKDAFGNELQSGDTVTVIKDLKVKGASSVLKSGTKVKNIRLVESSDGHNISCKIEGFGAMNLKSEFVKKN